MPSEFDYALTQLNRLEAGHRRLRRRTIWLAVLVVGQGLALLYLLLPVGRLGVPKSLEASRFVLVDDAGRVRGEWAMDQGPVLQLLTEKGQERAALWVNHAGAASLILLDNRGAAPSVLVYATDDRAGLEMRDRPGARGVFEVGGPKGGLRVIDEPAPRAPGGPQP